MFNFFKGDQQTKESILKEDYIFKISKNKNELLSYLYEIFEPEIETFKLDSTGFVFLDDFKTVIKWKRLKTDYCLFIPGDENESNVVRGPWN